jgi:3-isopropylmalate/(R)-2-methylmalate dehydratase large subunit
MKRTLFDKLWDLHEVEMLEDGLSLLYIDRIFLHERTGSIALQSLQENGHSVRSPERAFCTMDHIVDTFPGRSDDTLMPSGRDFIETTRALTRDSGIRLFDINDPLQGIVHVISPEQGIVQPGLSLICPDSHTCTQGALGALAWGVGSSDVEHALVTQTLRVKRPGNMRVRFEGTPRAGVSAKDMMLHLIGDHGAAGGSGFAVEFAGSAVRALDLEARMTLCNMAAEFSAFTGLIAPDAKTIAYLQDKPRAPRGDNQARALAHWKTLHSDTGAHFDREIVIDMQDIAPTVTWGTSPQHTMAISAAIPNPCDEADAGRRAAMEKALAYQGLKAGTAASEIIIDAAFIGSCTNARLSDLRDAASVLQGRQVAPDIVAVVVPGSSTIKRQAEAEGLDQVFQNAGFQWRESGCSMCSYAGGETFGPGKRVISSTNRNFEGRQGPGTRTHLASPMTVAASAIRGRITDPREFLGASAPDN